MKRSLEQAGWEVLSTWAMGDDLDALARAGEAAVNLVVSSVGLRSAEVLKRKFGTPYVVGTPVGKFTERLVNILEQTVESREDTIAYLSNRLAGEAEITVIGEPVTMGSLAAAIEMQTKRPVQVLCPLRETEGLLSFNDAAVRGEEELEMRLKGAKNIVADPLYRPICPPESRFYELPHIAFSGRIYLKKLPVFAELCR